MSNKKRQQGVILLYTVLAVSLFFAIASSVVSGTVRSLNSGKNERAAATAAAAADAGYECGAHWQLMQGTDSVWTSGGTVNCDTGTSVDNRVRITTVDLYDRVNLVGGLPDCTVTTPVTYTFDMEFQNSACAHVTVTVEDDALACKVSVESRGVDDCDEPTVERVIWGGF